VVLFVVLGFESLAAREREMTIEINTTEYELSHGKKPRGRGSWAFQNGNHPEPFWSSPYQLYTQALADACKLAMAKGEWRVKVLP
jgi:hypothetical protein